MTDPWPYVALAVAFGVSTWWIRRALRRLELAMARLEHDFCRVEVWRDRFRYLPEEIGRP